VYVCGPEDEHRLDEVTAPSPGMQVFDAAGICLQLKSLGYMTLLLPSVPEPDNGLHRLTANNVILSGYRIGMVSARTYANELAALGRSRATPGRDDRSSTILPSRASPCGGRGGSSWHLRLPDVCCAAPVVSGRAEQWNSRESSLATQPRDRYYSRCEGRANYYPSQHERSPTMPPSLPGARAGLDVLGHRYLAVVVDAWSGHV